MSLEYLQNYDWSRLTKDFGENLILLLAIFLVAYIALWITKRFFIPVIEKALVFSSFKWDDLFVKHNFFPTLSLLVPIIIVYVAGDIFFLEKPLLVEIIKRASMTLFVLVSAKCLGVLLLITRDNYNTLEIARDKPITGYLSAIKIVTYILAGIFVISVLTDKSPWGILSILGGLTAVLILIFKDTILGFVAHMQLSGNNMVRIGDWIEMPRYDADGDVIDVSIHTVKVQNWDKTITTIPTYALVSHAFKNWRGMSESSGRRIKRHICLDMNSIKFCTNEMLAKFAKLNLLKDYLSKKQSEIDTYNKGHNFDPSDAPNGRRQTNIGIFRTYIKAYLTDNPKIHQDMTFLVRQLAPTAKGLPIEVYVFSNDQRWAFFEDIQADIFDHLLAMIPEFELKIFQEPTGGDFGKLHCERENGSQHFRPLL